jgi:hypothetical protein
LLLLLLLLLQTTTALQLVRAFKFSGVDRAQNEILFSTKQTNASHCLLLTDAIRQTAARTSRSPTLSSIDLSESNGASSVTRQQRVGSTRDFKAPG